MAKRPAKRKSRSKVVEVNLSFVARFRVPEGSNLDDLDDAANSLSLLAPMEFGLLDAELDEWSLIDPPDAAPKRK